MDVAAEQDAAARAAGQLAVAKLRLLPEVESQLCRVELQQPCLEHNLLGALATWLRPGEDGSLPNLRLRTTLLTICSRLPVDTQEQDGREQLKRSGLGKVIMFYKLHDEVAANRILAARMVEAWSRPIFALSAVYKARAPRVQRPRERVSARG
jgi:transcription factor SPN1